MKERIAVIDLGTNTFHLLIAELENKKTNILHREKQPVKIGVGGINQQVIREAAIQRGVTCIKKFRETIDQWNVNLTLAFGTSALRNAINGLEVIEKIKKESGIEIKLISGDEEAEYIYFGVRSALSLGKEKSLIVDIGGGSVEFIIGDGEKIYWKESFEIGAQRLLEQYQKHDPINAEEIKALDVHFVNSLAPLIHAIHNLMPTILVGSSGTFDTLSEIYCFNHHIDIASHPSETPLTISDFYKIHEEIISKDRVQRLQIPGMIEMRADMIVVASCLVKYLLTKFSFQKIRVSSYSLKEGVLAKWKASKNQS